MFKRNKKDVSPKIKDYSGQSFFVKLPLFIGYKFYDAYRILRYGRPFSEYGVSFFVGEQGSGKSIAMTEYLESMRAQYPDVMIVTNYGYIHQTQEFTDWKDFFNIRNGEKGVIFAIDEIQNEFNNKSWKNFPEELLSEITQQRKQKIKIVCTSQIYEDVAIQLRRQAFFIIECMTVAGRWTIADCYKRKDYEKSLNSVEGTGKVRKMWRKTFVQDGHIRTLYNTELKIERLQRTTFMSKKDRGVV